MRWIRSMGYLMLGGAKRNNVSPLRRKWETHVKEEQRDDALHCHHKWIGECMQCYRGACRLRRWRIRRGRPHLYLCDKRHRALATHICH